MRTRCFTASAVSASFSTGEPLDQKTRSGLHSSAILCTQSRTALFVVLCSPGSIRCSGYRRKRDTQYLLLMAWGKYPIPTATWLWQTHPHQNQHECVRVTGVFQPASPAAPPWLSSPGPFLLSSTVLRKIHFAFSGLTPLPIFHAGRNTFSMEPWMVIMLIALLSVAVNDTRLR